MLRPPLPHPLHVLVPAEVPRVLRPAQPRPLARRLARLAARPLAAVFLGQLMPRVRREHFLAVQTVPGRIGVHAPLAVPPSAAVSILRCPSAVSGSQTGKKSEGRRPFIPRRAKKTDPKNIDFQTAALRRLS